MFLQLLATCFKSREDLISSTKEIYLEQGYAISIKCSRKEKYVVLGCDRGGCYRNKLNISAEDRKRKSGSRLINCPFQFRGKKQLDGSWKLKMENNLHNHESSSHMSGHPSCRQLSEEQTLVIERMTRAGVQTRQILSALRQENVNRKVIVRTIANMKFRIKKEKLAGRTPIQALFDELGRDFQKVKERMCLAIENDFQEIKSRLSGEKIRTLHDCNIMLFRELNTQVSHFAMKELSKQWELVRSGKMRPTCTGQFKTIMGLPCAHMLYGWKENVISI
ncbi:hypothetical protein POM88_011163 [Heracleum sosnowskyi]|uniref:Protein FAR1-RELATED SEQUENCE n=1 Tax=Heracleum sosnowskyi TaxID=360622 RepID=A0AAD8IU13_9APIA|nr:hypothetical protein POM88_011163 [Heracleum sosnowskyi]